MKRYAVLFTAVCVGFMFAADSAAAQSQCEQDYQSCVRSRGANCEGNFQRCVLRKCPNAPFACSKLPECEMHCTESATSNGGILSCCDGGPKHVNACPNKIDGNCRPRQTGPSGQQGQPQSGQGQGQGQGGQPPQMPQMPQGGGGSQGGGQPTETPRTGCEAGFSVADCPPVTPAPTLVISASPAEILQEATSTLSWSATNATSCTASGGWSGLKTASGTAMVAPTSTATYTLECHGAGGNVSKSATVVVFPVTSATFAERITDALLQLTGEDSEDGEGTNEFFNFVPILIGQGPQGTVWNLLEKGAAQNERPVLSLFTNVASQPSTFSVVGSPTVSTGFVSRFAQAVRSIFDSLFDLWRD